MGPATSSLIAREVDVSFSSLGGKGGPGLAVGGSRPPHPSSARSAPIAMVPSLPLAAATVSSGERGGRG
eukprot:10494435-Heterocapsa_arctica.AAC.1